MLKPSYSDLLVDQITRLNSLLYHKIPPNQVDKLDRIKDERNKLKKILDDRSKAE